MARGNRFAGITEFMAVARLGSFTAAGAALGLTKSAVSKSVARLEQRLDVGLFHRTTRRLSLTSDGQAFLDVCTNMTTELESFEDTIGAGLKTPSGRVRISLPSAFGRRYVTPILIDLMGQYPDLAISANFTDRRVDLIEEGFDIAVRIGIPPDTTDLVSKQIGVQTLVICGSPAYLALHGAPTAKEDLALHRCIVGRRNRTRHAWLLRGDDESTERYPVTAFQELEDGEAMLAAAEAGLGLAQLPTWLASEQFQSGALVPVLEGLSGGEVPISALWVNSAPLPLRIRVLVDAFVRKLSSSYSDRSAA